MIIGMLIRRIAIDRRSETLIDQIDQDRRAGRSCRVAIIESTVRRFRPIVLTSAATALAMIPLSQSTFFGPMAIAVMGGLTIATLLTLILLPAMYAAWFKV